MTQLIALVQIPPGPGIAHICERAEALGASVSREGEGALITANSGTISAKPLANAIELTLVADSEDAAGMMRGAIDGLAAQTGIAAPEWRVVAAAPAGKSRLMAARLVAKERLSPSYYRIRLAGEFEVFTKGGLHFRLLIGPDSAGWPENGADGIIWPGGIDAWHRPPYTVRAVGAAGDWIDVDIFLHIGGRVTEWCEEILPGDRVMLTGPGGRGVKQAGWLGLIGDETALPVVLRAIAAADPAVQGEAMILISDPADRQEVALPEGLRLSWVLRDGKTGLMDLLARLQPPARDRFIFFAGERAEAEAARDWAKTAGIGNGEFLAAAYWTAGWVPPETQRQAKGRALRPADAG